MNRLLLLFVMVVAASTLLAQAGGSIAGTIKDPSGVVVPGVSVRITQLETGRQQEALTDEKGAYQADALGAGNYTVQAELPGFSREIRTPIALQANQTVTVDLGLKIDTQHQEVRVTARRVEEEAQDVPIPLSVLTGATVERTGAFNVNRLKELIPTVQLYSSNPRNTAVTIRGLGSPFGLTNDGIEPGVGFYVDGVYYARPAATTLDFLDVERIEVLRGPQGTLFGKNTTSGNISITTRRPTFTPETNFELSYGNYGFVQAKGSFSGPLSRKVAVRASFSGTQRDGLLFNVRTQDDVNDLNNVGFRGQLLYTPRGNMTILLSGDYSRQRPEGYAQVIAGVAPTLRAANRQYAAIASDLGYTPPSFNAFDRLIDTDTPWRSNQAMGGGSGTLEWDFGTTRLSAITAWRFWDWDPSNDRDFIGLPVTTISAAPSRQTQWTQEIRYAGRLSDRANFLIGTFVFNQSLAPSPFHKQEQGSAAARFLLAPSANAATPGLLDGYGQNIDFDFRNTSAAAFGQLEYALTSSLKLTPGLRINYDKKKLDYDQQVYGGLQTTNAALIALQRSVLSPLTYKANVSDGNVSGQLTLSYKATENVNAYATYGTGFKSIGLNLGGVPQDAAGNPIVSAATVKPERVRSFEIGVKTKPFSRVTANVSAFHTGIRDFQTQVVNAQVGVLRGYLANASKVGVKGVEFDANATLNDHFTVYTAVAATDAKYISFTDAPPPLEETGGPQVKDISGSVLPGISKWSLSVGGEATNRSELFTRPGELFARIDASYRSAFSSSSSASRYLNIGAYALVNAQIGFRTLDKWTFSVWGRNLLNRDYYELLSGAPGSSGLYEGLPGDPRTLGVTLKKTF